MSELETIAISLRIYAWKHPWDQPTILKMLVDKTQFPEAYARELMIDGRMVRVQFTIIHFTRLTVANMSFSHTDGSRVDDDLADRIRKAFFHPDDYVQEFDRQDRALAYGSMGWDPRVVHNTRQFIVMGPREGEDWRHAP